ncbi:MAG: endolytic transglycosylase MltG [Ruminococcaceae bacterium]|nr:endolytic transglycosylase MltG [Oscillospiraceae bacterium]
MENENMNLPESEETAKPSVEVNEPEIIEESAAPEGRGGKHAAKRKKSTKKIVLIVLAVVFAILLIFGITCVCDYLGVGFSSARDVTIEVPQGASTAKIAEMLEDADIIDYPMLFRIYTKVKGYDGLYKYGEYTFNTKDGYSAVAKVLMSEGAREKTARVTIPERSTIDEIAAILEEAGVCEKADFFAALEGDYKYDFIKTIPTDKVHYKFEGYLFPETYDFYCYDSAECAVLAVERMLAQTDKVLSETGVYEKAADSEYSVHEIMTMASIVELEASGEEAEMPKVAKVFYNRLENWDAPKLGSSPTRKYPYGNGSYDTNEIIGLPPGPYCSPSKNAIRASLSPEENFEATFFVTDADMNFYYTYSYSEHINTINKLKSEGNWIYETY